MKFLEFVEEKIGFILFMFSFVFISALFLTVFRVNFYFILFLSFILIFYLFFYLFLLYLRQKRKSEDVINIVDSMEDKYLISEVIEKPKSMLNYAYYYALKEACKAMNDKIGKLEQEKIDYMEYVESFVHEIKTPISVISLECDNNGNASTKEEIDKICNLVDQMLFYARSEDTEKDYFVKKLNLEDVTHQVILKYKNSLLSNKITVKTSNLSCDLYSDEKWLVFIISQIVQNSIKYMEKKEKIISIEAISNKNNIILSIKDNGSGIDSSDLPRVCTKGFTGRDRKKEHSTGMGLYLSQKLCYRLGLFLEIKSKLNEGTTVSIIFPKSSVYKF